MKIPLPARVGGVAALLLVASGLAHAVASVGTVTSGTDFSVGGDTIAWSVSSAQPGCTTPSLNNGYLYEYTLGAVSDRLSGFSIPLDNETDACNIQAPAGWLFTLGETLEFFPFEGGLNIGLTAGVFSFNSDFDFKKAIFTVFGSDGPFPIDPPIPNAPGIAAVSTPSTLALALLGLAAVSRRRQAR